MSFQRDFLWLYVNVLFYFKLVISSIYVFFFMLSSGAGQLVLVILPQRVSVQGTGIPVVAFLGIVACSVACNTSVAT